jgi:hypothetical protein
VILVVLVDAAPPVGAPTAVDKIAAAVRECGCD